MSTPHIGIMSDPIFGASASVYSENGYTRWRLPNGRQYAITGNFVAPAEYTQPSMNFPECRARIESAWSLGVTTPLVTIEQIIHPDDMTEDQQRDHTMTLNNRIAAATALFVGGPASKAMEAATKAFPNHRTEFLTAGALTDDVDLNRIRLVVDANEKIEGDSKLLDILHG